MKQERGYDLLRVEEAELRLLGKRVSTFSSTAKLSFGTFFLSGFLIAASGVTTFQFVLAPQLSMLVACIILSSAAAGSVLRQKWQRTINVHLYQNGLIYDRRRHGRVILWPEVSEIYDISASKTNSRDRLIRLDLIDGSRLKFRNLDGIMSLSRRINGVISNRLLERIKDVFRSGNWIRFGNRVAMSRHGIQIGMKVVGWLEIGQINFDDSRGLQIRLGSTTAWELRVPKSHIANVQLLKGLLDWIKENPSITNDSEYRIDDDRAISVADQFQSELDPNELLREGYEWDEVEDVIRGECTMDELLSRGPRQRPRNPK